MKTCFLLLALLLGGTSLLSAQVFDVEILKDNGPRNERINVVILGDGFQEAELDQFIIEATNIMDDLFDEPPFSEYETYFNVFAIKVPSTDSDIDHPGTASDVDEPATPVVEADTYFDMTFDGARIHRLLVVGDRPAVTAVLANNLPEHDIVLLLGNSTVYGGSGGSYATTSLASSAAQIAIHEIGHSFGRLSDEYWAGDVFARETLNQTRETDPALVKWSNWHGDNGIGIYPKGTSGNAANWYRPHQNCKMRRLNSPFCSVCIEAFVERIHQLVDPIDAYTPASPQLGGGESSYDFSLSLLQPTTNSLRVVWRLNEDEIGGTRNQSAITLAEGAITQFPSIITVTVEDTSAFLRIDNHAAIHQDVVTWTVSKALPVTWLSFTAAARRKQVDLAWQTSSETDNRGFEIQRSADGTDWQVLGWQASAPRTSGRAQRAYAFTDRAPLPGQNLYRLRQIDYDGTATFSEVRSVAFGPVAGMVLYPNPTANVARLLAPVGSRVEDIRIRSLDQRILRRLIGSGTTLDLSGLPAGTYLVEATINGERFRQQLIKR